MQINFTPRKIKNAKSHIEKLLDKEINNYNRKHSKPSFFKRVWRLMTKPFNISSKSQ